MALMTTDKLKGGGLRCRKCSRSAVALIPGTDGTAKCARCWPVGTRQHEELAAMGAGPETLTDEDGTFIAADPFDPTLGGSKRGVSRVLAKIRELGEDEGIAGRHRQATMDVVYEAVRELEPQGKMIRNFFEPAVPPPGGDPELHPSATAGSLLRSRPRKGGG